jgi:hypothetical protein
MADNKLYHLGPDIPGNINNFKVDRKNLMIDVPHPDSKDGKAVINFPYNSFMDWASENVSDSVSDVQLIQKFVTGLLSNAHEIDCDNYSSEEDDNETLFEIVNADGSLISGDEPQNDKSTTGAGTKNSTDAINTTFARKNFFYPGYSIGYISW